MSQPFAVDPPVEPEPDSGGPPPDVPRSPNGDPLLSAKLSIPPVPRTYVARERLHELLTAASNARLTVVHGPAGSGKTALVSGWVRAGGAPGPVAWLTLDEDDNAPGVFWSYLVAALGGDVPGLGRPTQADAVDRSLLARLATSLAQRSTPVVVVLDRAEHITNRSIPADLDLLIQYSTPGLRLVVIGRGTRLVHLHRYQVAGELTEVDADDLALTYDETREFLRAYGVRPVSDDVVAVRERTEGWVTGACLYALALRSRADGAPEAYPGGPRAVAEFLRTEVFDAQPSLVRSLLLRTSILEEVHPDLADRLTGRGDARAILDELIRTNAFVRPVAESWFRYAAPLRAMLRDELRSRRPWLTNRLHAEAAQWYAERRMYRPALRHATRIGDWEYAADLAMTRVGAAWLLTAPDAGPVRQVLAALPDSQTGPYAALLRAVLALARFDTAAARAAIDVAAGYRHPSVPLRVGIGTVSVVIGRLTGDVDAAELAATELDSLWGLLSPDGSGEQARTRAFMLANLGVVQFWAGRYPAARTSLGRAAASTEPGTEYVVHDALAHLALLEVFDGKVHRADKYARESLAAADRAALSPADRVGAASATLAGIALLWNDLPAVREHLSRVIATTGSRYDPPTATALALLRARLAGVRPDGRRALAAADAARGTDAGWHVYPDVLDQAELAAFGAHLMLGETAAARGCLEYMSDSPERTLALGHLHLTEGDAAKARSVLAAAARRAARPTTQVVATLSLGRLAFLEGDPAGALRALQEALDLARPEQLRRPFAEAGAWVRQLLREHPELAAQHAWVSPRTGTPPLHAELAPVVEPLTEREVEVLDRLAQALSTEDIANSLYLSVNTVKTHLKSIYRKLGTPGRSAAARRARELNLLPVVECDH